MSNSLNASEDDLRLIMEHFQQDMSCAGELGSTQCNQNKDDQPYSQHPWHWTVQTPDQIVYGTIQFTNNFCKQCQNMFHILTDILLCWDEVPPMWATARFATESSRRAGLPILYAFLVSFGDICLTTTTDCRFCTFFAQLICSTLQGEGITHQTNVAVLLGTDNIGKAEPKPDADDVHNGTSRWRKALGLGIYDARFGELLPLPGTVFLSDELEKI
jgi:hypothetical protein